MRARAGVARSKPRLLLRRAYIPNLLARHSGQGVDNFSLTV